MTRLETLFSLAAARHPAEAVAIWDRPAAASASATPSASWRSTSFRTLDAWSNQIARALLALPKKGLRPFAGARVCVSLPRSAEMVAAILGILKTGNLYVPVDPSYPDGYTDVVLHACEPSAILTAGHLASRLRARAPNVPVVALTGGDSGGSDGSSSGSGSGSGSVSSSSGSGSGAPSVVPSWQGLDDGPLLASELERPPNDDGEGSAGGAGKEGEAKGETEAEADRVGAIDDDCCYILFTSGSTGPPKGVVGRHSAAINRCAWMHAAYPFDEGEVMCHKTSLNFVDRYGGNRERDGGREGEGATGATGATGGRGVIYRVHQT